MGPGKVTTEAGGWITTVESGHCRTQGSLAVSARGAGAATPQEGTHRLEQDIFQAGKESWKTHQGLGKGVGKELYRGRQGEIPKRLPRAGLTLLIRRVKRRKLDRGLQSLQLFYTYPDCLGHRSRGWWRKRQGIMKTSKLHDTDFM